MAISGISRSDISFNVCNISTKVSEIEVRDAILLNKIIKPIKSEENQTYFPSLEISEKVKLVVYTDAKFNNLPDWGSQGEYTIFITDAQTQAAQRK